MEVNALYSRHKQSLWQLHLSILYRKMDGCSLLTKKAGEEPARVITGCFAGMLTAHFYLKF